LANDQQIFEQEQSTKAIILPAFNLTNRRVADNKWFLCWCLLQVQLKDKISQNLSKITKVYGNYIFCWKWPAAYLLHLGTWPNSLGVWSNYLCIAYAAHAHA